MRADQKKAIALLQFKLHKDQNLYKLGDALKTTSYRDAYSAKTLGKKRTQFQNEAVALMEQVLIRVCSKMIAELQCNRRDFACGFLPPSSC